MSLTPESDQKLDASFPQRTRRRALDRRGKRAKTGSGRVRRVSRRRSASAPRPPRTCVQKFPEVSKKFRQKYPTYHPRWGQGTLARVQHFLVEGSAGVERAEREHDRLGGHRERLRATKGMCVSLLTRNEEVSVPRASDSEAIYREFETRSRYRITRRFTPTRPIVQKASRLKIQRECRRRRWTLLSETCARPMPT